MEFNEDTTLLAADKALRLAGYDYAADPTAWAEAKTRILGLTDLWGQFKATFDLAVGRSETGRRLAALGMEIIEADLADAGIVPIVHDLLGVVGWQVAR